MKEKNMVIEEVFEVVEVPTVANFKMVSFKERIMKVKAVGARVQPDGKLETIEEEFEFEGHRNDGRVQRMVDGELWDKGYRLTVVSIGRTERVYEMPANEFKKIATIAL